MRAPESLVETVLRVLTETYGVEAEVYDPPFLKKTVEKRMSVTGMTSVAAYADYLAAHRDEADLLGQSLRVIYSEFFRSPLAFALLEYQVLPALIDEKTRCKHGEIRIWSAGCASGQEVWSLAMLLDELIGRNAAPLAYRIFATDLSEPDLERARRASYSPEALSNVRLRHLRACFIQQENGFTIIPRLWEKVDFSRYDLLDESSACPPASIYGDFDLILCCNLLFYYRPEVRRRLVDKIGRSLAPGGYFMTGEVEREVVGKARGFRSLSLMSPIFRKERVS